jgi:hypothetical protein
MRFTVEAIIINSEGFVIIQFEKLLWKIRIYKTILAVVSMDAKSGSLC